MRFTIVGAGAVGGSLGAFLARAGHQVVLVDRVEEHVRAINAAGLRLEGPRPLHVRVPARLPEEVHGPLGAVVLAVKSHDTEPALAPIALRFGGRDPAAVARAWEGERAFWRTLEVRRTGIWRDLAIRRRKTEADGQLGVLIQQAEEAGVHVPRNRAVYRLIREIESGERGFSWANLDEVALAAMPEARA